MPSTTQTDGENWSYSENWLSDAPLDESFTIDDGRVRALNLGANKLSGEIPAELGRLSNLTTLALNHNELSGEIPAELGSLSKDSADTRMNLQRVDGRYRRSWASNLTELSLKRERVDRGDTAGVTSPTCKG